MIHPEFQSGARWAHSSGTMGITLQNVGSMIFVSYHFVKSRINQCLNMEAFGRRKFQKLRHQQYFAEKQQGLQFRRKYLQTDGRWTFIENTLL